MSDDIIEQARMDAIQGRYRPPHSVLARRVYDAEHERVAPAEKKLPEGGAK